MKSRLRSVGPSFLPAVVASFAAGLYAAVFYVVNNLTMLQGTDVLFLLTILTLPLCSATAIVHHLLYVAGREGAARFAAAFFAIAFLFIVFRPSLVSIGLVSAFFDAFPTDSRDLANALFVAIPSSLLAFVFQSRRREFAMVAGLMTETSTCFPERLVSFTLYVANSA